MAITTISALTGTTAVAFDTIGVDFVTSGPFVFYGDYFTGPISGENATLYRLGPSGDYVPATNADGIIRIGAAPNTIYIDNGGNYRIGKTATLSTTSVGYEEV